MDEIKAIEAAEDDVVTQSPKFHHYIEQLPNDEEFGWTWMDATEIYKQVHGILSENGTKRTTRHLGQKP